MEIPTIRVQALTGYEIGVAIGARFARMIQSRIANDPMLLSALLPYSASEAGQRLVQALSTTNRYASKALQRSASNCSTQFFFGTKSEYILENDIQKIERVGSTTVIVLEGKNSLQQAEQVRERYPEYWDELCGLADGSSVPFLQVLLLNFRKEISSFLPAPTPSSSAEEADQCSDVLLCSGTLAMVAHNEDADVSLRDHVYLVHCTLESSTSFFAYTYAGELPSCAFGFNSHGVAFTVNSVPPTPDEVVPGGIGRNFVCRDLLEAWNINDALNRIRGVNLSVGHNYNLMDLNLQRILTVEAASRGRYFAQEINEEPFFHANIFLHLLEVHQTSHESSNRRQERVVGLPKLTKEDMLTLLGDSSDQDFPIYMQGPKLYTLHTVLFDLNAKRMTIYKGNPKSQSILLQISMQL